MHLVDCRLYTGGAFGVTDALLISFLQPWAKINYHQFQRRLGSVYFTHYDAKSCKIDRSILDLNLSHEMGHCINNININNVSQCCPMEALAENHQLIMPRCFTFKLNCCQHILPAFLRVGWENALKIFDQNKDDGTSSGVYNRLMIWQDRTDGHVAEPTVW